MSPPRLALPLVLLGLTACKKAPEAAPPAEPPAADAPAADDASGPGAEKPEEESPYLDAGNFNREVESHLPEIVTCYRDTVGKRSDAPTGRVKTTVVIDSQGVVKDVTYDPQRSTLKDEALQACITGKVKAWKFNISLTGAETPMPYTFDLTAGALLD